MQKRGTALAQQRTGRERPALLNAEIVSFGFCKMSRNEIADHRRRPGQMPEGWGPIQSSTFRYSDDQTVTAMAALQQAIEKLDGADPRLFDRWGVVASSRFLGRGPLLLALHRFRSEGVWGVTPHLIPHYALHSPAGTLSLVLGIHGPSLGTGGGLFSATEGLLTALTWLTSLAVPGVWFVTTGWRPEWHPEREDRPSVESECQAIALGLVAESTSSPTAKRPRLRIVVSPQPTAPRPVDIMQLAGQLDGDPLEPTMTASPGGRVLFHKPHSASAIPGPHFDLTMQTRLARHTIGTDAAGHVHVELLTTSSDRVEKEG